VFFEDSNHNESMSVKIISSNIRFDNPEDGEHTWEKRREILSECLLDFKPDIIGTQEGRRPQLEDLHSLLPDYKIAEEHRSWIPERMYPCIFFNPISIEIVNSGDIWLSETPHIPGSSSFDSAFPRLCTWVKGRIKRSAQKFMLVNVHLDHSKGSVREKQIEVLVREVTNENSHGWPLILMGDFNEAPTKAVRRIIKDGFKDLYDPWKKLKKEKQNSHHNFGKHADYADRIDWVLLPPEFTAEEVFLDEWQKDGIYPSDHYPLKCQFSHPPS
jgi:endonuclease/exonuclease/phosphatase family metal-dependent hydrolase